MQSTQIMTTIGVRFFRIPKVGERGNASCEDSCGFTQLGAHAAVADGVGHSHLPAMWARILVDSFCKSEGALDDLATREGWRAKALQWYADEIRQRSLNLNCGERIRGRIQIPAPERPSAATFCGVRFEEDPTGLVAEVLSRGDAFGFHIRAGKLVVSSSAPVGSSGLGTWAIESHPAFDWSSLETKRWRLQPRDWVVLATDKVAAKLFEVCSDESDAGINDVLEMRNLESFQRWTSGLVEDDHTLMILEVLAETDKVADQQARRVIVSDREGYYTIVEGLLCPDRLNASRAAATKPKAEGADLAIAPPATSSSVPQATDPLGFVLLIATCLLATLYILGGYILNGKLRGIQASVEAIGSTSIRSQLTNLMERQKSLDSSFVAILSRLTEDQANQGRIGAQLQRLAGMLGEIGSVQGTVMTNVNDGVARLRAAIADSHTNISQVLQRQGEALQRLDQGIGSLLELEESQQARVLLGSINPQDVRRDAANLLQAFREAYPRLAARHLKSGGPVCNTVAVVIFIGEASSDLQRELTEVVELAQIRAQFRWFVVKASVEPSGSVWAVPMADFLLSSRELHPHAAVGGDRNSE